VSTSVNDGVPSRQLRRIVWGALAVVFVLVLVTAVVDWSRPSNRTAPPVEGTVPDFQLIERSGRRVTRADLRGQVWVADFIFTRCTSICPALTASMGRLRTDLRNRGETSVRFVSFSVDPHYDTPSVLQEYARPFAADDSVWWFLTGDRAALYTLIGDGFRLAVAARDDPAATDPNELITHSDRFVLVDGNFQIRGYYRGTEDEALAQLVHDIAAVRTEATTQSGSERDS
jgi:protein SCO1/2